MLANLSTCALSATRHQVVKGMKKHARKTSGVDEHFWEERRRKNEIRLCSILEVREEGEEKERQEAAGFSPNARTAGRNPVVLQKPPNKFRVISRPSRPRSP